MTDWFEYSRYRTSLHFNSELGSEKLDKINSLWNSHQKLLPDTLADVVSFYREKGFSTSKFFRNCYALVRDTTVLIIHGKPRLETISIVWAEARPTIKQELIDRNYANWLKLISKYDGKYIDLYTLPVGASPELLETVLTDITNIDSIRAERAVRTEQFLESLTSALVTTDSETVSKESEIDGYPCIEKAVRAKNYVNCRLIVGIVKYADVPHGWIELYLNDSRYCTLIKWNKYLDIPEILNKVANNNIFYYWQVTEPYYDVLYLFSDIFKDRYSEDILGNFKLLSSMLTCHDYHYDCYWFHRPYSRGIHWHHHERFDPYSVL